MTRQPTDPTHREKSVRNDQAAPTSIRAAIRSLHVAQKSNRGTPLYSRLVNRPMGRVFAAVAFRVGLTPNQVTLISMCCTYVGIALIALLEPAPFVGFVVAALLVVGYALDSADGQLARLRGGGSLTGEWLDHMGDCVKNATVHLAVLISFYRFFDFDRDAAMLVPILFTAVSSTMYFGVILTDKIRRPDGPVLTSNDATRPSMARSILVLPADPGAVCVVMAVLGFHRVFFVAYSIIFAGCTVYMAGRLVKWYRDVRALDAQDALVR